MSCCEEVSAHSRRSWLKTVSAGFGYLAFANLTTNAASRDGGPLAPKTPHFPARAKRVLYLCMKGGPSHVDTFDYKPELQAADGREVANRLRGGSAKLLASPWKFQQHGESGLWISSLFPEVARQADDLCLIRGMQTDLPAHPQAFLQMHTGSFQFVRPSLGAWTLYGLGTENENLPGFISLNPTPANGGSQNYGSSFLPAIFQGTRIGFEGRPVAGAQVANIANPRLTSDAQRVQLDFIQALNRSTLAADGVNPQVEGVIESYELAFRMQGEVPRVMDLAAESDATKKLYGVGEQPTDDFGRQCLLARRFLEAGVRFVEVTHGDWDQHRNLRADHERHVTGGGKASVKLPQFKAINTLLGNLKTAISGSYHAFDFAKYAHRYLAEFQYRFNRRFDMRALLARLLAALVAASPCCERVLRTAEVHG